jgi:hypothetical protein
VGSCWNPGSFAVHCFHIVAVVASFLVVEIDLDFRRVSRSAASAACPSQDFRKGKSLQKTWDQGETSESLWLVRI